MNLSSHIKKQREDLRESLKGNKAEIISKLLVCVQNAHSLLGDQDFQFWQEQMQKIEASEIPMTSYGLGMAKNDLNRAAESQSDTRSVLGHEILGTCEAVIAYSNEDDVCYMQSDFRYFFDEAANSIVKGSELGVCVDLNGADVLSEHYDRIAKISELNIDKNELVL